jgi:hypothetical protein
MDAKDDRRIRKKIELESEEGMGMRDRAMADGRCV